jgi:hypothetical protein
MAFNFTLWAPGSACNGASRAIAEEISKELASDMLTAALQITLGQRFCSLFPFFPV